MWGLPHTHGAVPPKGPAAGFQKTPEPDDITSEMTESRKILVVEDNPNMSGLLTDMLDVFEVPSISATDGLDALRKLEVENIGLVISDMRMPQMTGAELLKAVKERNPDLPVVLISGFSLSDVEAEGVGAKADGFLMKPFRMSDIKAVLDRFFTP